jgi:hypothetical protein
VSKSATSLINSTQSGKIATHCLYNLCIKKRELLIDNKRNTPTKEFDLTNFKKQNTPLLSWGITLLTREMNYQFKKEL